MKIKVAVVALLVTLLAVSGAYATVLPATISWGAGQPTTGTGYIQGAGTYTTQDGWNVRSVIMTVTPSGGGIATTKGANFADGNWGTVKIEGLATGQYVVFVTITVRKGEETVSVNSPISIVNVP